jgi:hypothetical protein
VITNDKDVMVDVKVSTPVQSFKDAESSPPWTEVVRRGKGKNRTDKIRNNEGALSNIRGMNKPGRAKCLKYFIIDNHLDFVGIQESKKETFPPNFLDFVNKNMVWNFVPANGTRGGILVGIKA